MQVPTVDVTASERYLADIETLSFAMEAALYLVVLTLSILFTLFALSYLRTYFRSRFEMKVAPMSSKNRPENAIPLTRPSPEETA